MRTTKAPGPLVGGPTVRPRPPARRRRRRRRAPRADAAGRQSRGRRDHRHRGPAAAFVRGRRVSDGAVDRRGRPARRRRARARCAAGSTAGVVPQAAGRLGRRGRWPRRGSSRGCASAGTPCARSSRRRARAGWPSARSRTCCHEPDGDYLARGRRARDRARSGADRAPVHGDGLQRRGAGAHLRGRPAAPALHRGRPRRRAPARRAAAARARLRPGARADRRRRGAALPPLRPRAAHARRRARRSRWPRRCAGSRRELLPLASPIMEHVHRRFMAHFVEQDVIGHMEADLGEATLDLGRLRVAIAFADLAGYTRLTEEAGEEEAVGAVERFVEVVEHTLPDDARVIKTIGDEVMVVGSDPSSLVDWAVGFQQLSTERPLPRIGMHWGETIYRDGDYYGREVNQAHRVAARAAGGEVIVTRPVVEASGPHLEFERIGEVSLKGFSEPTELFLARPGRRGLSGGRPRARAGGRAAGARRAGGRPAVRAAATPSACSTWRAELAGRDARARAARRPRPAGRLGRRRPRVRARCARAWGSSSCVHRATPPEASRATCTPGPATSATAPAGAWRRAASRGWPRRTPPPTRPRRSSTGWPPRPAAGRCSGCPTSARALVRPLLRAGVTRDETAAWCAARGLRLAGGPRQRRRSLRPHARARAARAGAAGRRTPTRRRTSLRTAAAPARGGGRARRGRGRGRSAGRDHDRAWSELGALPPRAGAARRPPAGRGGHGRRAAPARPRAWTTSCALDRAGARSTWATAPARSCARASCASPATPPLAARRDA